MHSNIMIHQCPVDNINGLIPLLGVFLGFLLGLLGEPIKRLLFKPVLDIDIDMMARDCCHLTYRSDRVPVYYFRFRVTNLTKYIKAESVEVLVSEIFEKKDGKFFKKNDFMSLNLKWSYYDKKSKTKIQPTLSRFLDFGYIDDARGIVSNFCLETLFKPNNATSILSPGEYKIKIVLIANGADPMSKEYSLIFNGKWDINEEKMLSENIFISEIK